MRAAPGRNVTLLQRSEARLRERLTASFARLAAHVAAQIARRLGVAKASDPADEERAGAIANGIDLGDWSDIEHAIGDETAEVYADGYIAGSALVSFSVSKEQVNPRSVAWAKQHAAALVRQLEDSTRDMLRGAIVDAIEEGWGAVELGRQIEESPGFSRDRAETIGRTEVIAANNRGNFDAYQDSGVVEQVEWLTAHDDLVEEICEDNEAAGPITLGDAFPSGDDAPPAHPNCRCALIPALAEDVPDRGEEEAGE